MINEDQQIKNFIEAIERYYPMGLTGNRKNHPGFQQLLKITEDKTNAAINGLPAKWFDVADEIKNLWVGYYVINVPGTPFPAYQLRIVESDEAKTEFSKMVIVSISLLVPFFTVFLKEQWKQGDDDRKTVISNGEQDADVFDRITRTKETINKYYPEYNFADPKILFTYKVQERYAFAATSSELAENVIYEYLFSHDMTGESYVFKYLIL
jgi:hypothetical protein